MRTFWALPLCFENVLMCLLALMSLTGRVIAYCARIRSVRANTIHGATLLLHDLHCHFHFLQHELKWVIQMCTAKGQVFREEDWQQGWLSLQKSDDILTAADTYMLYLNEKPKVEMYYQEYDPLGTGLIDKVSVIKVITQMNGGEMPTQQEVRLQATAKSVKMRHARATALDKYAKRESNRLPYVQQVDVVLQHADINGDGMFNKPELVRGIALWCVPVRLPLPSRLRKPLLSPEPPLRASGRSGEVADLQLGPAGVFCFPCLLPEAANATAACCNRACPGMRAASCPLWIDRTLR